MQVRQRLTSLHSLFFAIILLNFGSFAVGIDDPWSAPALSQDAKVLLKASESFPTDSKAGATILINQMSFRFEEDGRMHHSVHTIYRIDRSEMVHALSAVSAVWQPWHQEKPMIRARVITPDGEVHQLDNSALVDSPAFEQRPELFDDFRVVGAPLPAVSVGSLVEVAELYEESRPAFYGGIVRTIYVGNVVPVENTRIEIIAPSSLPLRYELSNLPNAHVERAVEAGELHLTIVQGALAAAESIPEYTAGDVAVLPELRFSTGESWKDIAAKYAVVAEQQIRANEVQSLVGPITESKSGRELLIRELVQKLHQQVRYTGVELGISSYVPQPTSTVLTRHYGDCKDKAAVLVAMLRAAKIPAYMALLTPGRSEDIRPTLPGFGSFTHAIVYVPGTPERWIDATDEYARPDQLSAMDQGRLALIIRDNTTDVVRTPTSGFDQNVSVDYREINFEEFGAGKAKETFEAHGSFNEESRRMCDLTDEKSLRQIFLAHVKREFGAEDFSDFSCANVRDLGKPLRIGLSVDKVPYASAASQAAVVWMQAPSVRQWLPQALFHDFSDEDGNGKSQPSAPRTIDFVLPEAFVREWRYRLVVPPGLELRTLPADTALQLGPARITEKYQKEDDGAVLALMRFELPKQRLTPQEARDLVKGVQELEKRPAKGVFFDNKAYALLASGKVKEALAEYRRLIALHPKEALHHSEMASALVSLGLGEAARKEAEKATSLEPSSWAAWAAQGFVLEHDLIGRAYKKGFDRSAAIKAYERSLSLNPKDPSSRFNLAVLHEFNDQGQRYASDAEFDAALKEYKALEELPDKLANSDEALLYCFYFARRFDDVLTKGANLKQTPEILGLRVAATAMSKDAQTALELARSQATDIKDRSEALIQASRFLIRLRQYHEAATIEAAGVEISDNPASRSEQLEALRQTRRYEEALVPKSDPRSAIERLYLALYGKAKIAPIDAFSRLVTDGQDREEMSSAIEKEFGRPGLSKGFEGYSDDVVLDWLLSNFHYSIDGNEKTGYRIRVRRGTTQNAAFIVKEDSDWKLLELGRNVGPAGLAALAAINRGDMESARQWIDWGREEMEIRSNQDSLSGPIFPKIWQKGQQADRSTLEVVAAVMVSGSRWSASSISILQRAIAEAKSDEQRVNFQLALCSALLRVEQWRDLASVADKLVTKFPRSETAFHYLATAYVRFQQWNDLERISRDRLSRLPEDPMATRDLARGELTRGEIQLARATLKPLIENHPNPEDLNEYAWAALFTKSDEPEAIETAQRANNLTSHRNFAILHTLACLYAQTGKAREARQTLLDAMEAGHLPEPNDAIWFGLGRIADEYGEQQAALSAYNRVKRPKRPELESNSTWSLAQERIRTLLQDEEKGPKLSATSNSMMN
jgi:tetratricopeptide (TPR) repeat protein/transglutaminase-like putative cysteine protease